MSSQQDERLRGSCLCGAITYAIAEGGVGDLSHCHCSMCRKAHGAAFGTYGSVRWDDFELISGADQLRSYRSSAEITRTFCGTCGSTLQFIRDGRAGFGLAVGTLDSDPQRRAVQQIFVRDKAPWWELTDDPPQFDAYPPR
jgi:hypothetical protein